MSRLATMLALAVALGQMEVGAQPLVVTGTVRQLTVDPAAQVVARISGNRVVFTDQRSGNDDVAVVDVTTGVEVAVASTSRPERLNDISGHRVVYTDYYIVDPNAAPQRRVAVHDLTTGDTTYPSQGTEDQNPRIDGAVAAWERGLGNLANVVVFDLSTGEEAVIDFGGPELNPAPGGTRVAFEARVVAADPGDIYLYDTVTRTSVRVTATTEDDRRPDIDGDLVVWERSDGSGPNGLDIMVHDLASGVTRRLALPGNQRGPHVSGRVVTFDDDSLGDSNVALYFLDADQVVFTTTDLSNEFLNDVDGNRITFTSNNAGNNDIWLYEFLVEPFATAAPATGLDFGAVTVGQHTQQFVTIAHPQNTIVTVDSVTITGSGAADYASPLTLPQPIPVGAVLPLPVTFTPSAPGAHTAQISVTTNLGTLDVALAGIGTDPIHSPQQQIDDLIAFFDASVAAGTIRGVGSGLVAGSRLLAYRVLLESIRLAMAVGWNTLASQLLGAAVLRADGAASPADLINGPATGDLLQRIAALQGALAGA